jgi:hypothetical protein
MSVLPKRPCTAERSARSICLYSRKTCSSNTLRNAMHMVVSSAIPMPKREMRSTRTELSSLRMDAHASTVPATTIMIENIILPSSRLILAAYDSKAVKMVLPPI